MHHTHSAQSFVLKQRKQHGSVSSPPNSFQVQTLPTPTNHLLRSDYRAQKSPSQNQSPIKVGTNNTSRNHTPMQPSQSPWSLSNQHSVPPSSRPPNPRNYQIKSIRRGIPDIVTTDVKGRSFRLARKGMKITHNCICRKESAKRRSPLAWAFSVLVALICVILPLATFSADVMFFVISQRQFNATGELLVQAKILAPPNITSHVQLPEIPVAHKEWHADSHKNKKRTKTRHRKHKRSVDDPVSLVNVLKQQNSVAFATPTAPTVTSADVTTNQNVTYGNENPICGSLTGLLRYMTSNEAQLRMDAHHHVITEVFEPVIIIGSFPSIILCIFTRLVVMVTSHNHIISAYVTNVLVLPLQLITGALSVHAAAFHVGKIGFSCWQCAVLNICPEAGFDSWFRNDVNVALFISLAAKILDGLAAGCVIFTVIFRSIWKNQRHGTVWREIARVFITATSAVTCIPLTALLVATPALAVLRYEYIEFVPDFAGRETTSFLLMILFVTGVSAWCSSIFALFLYLLYRSYVYCRMKEHSDFGSI